MKKIEMTLFYYFKKTGYCQILRMRANVGIILYNVKMHATKSRPEGIEILEMFLGILNTHNETISLKSMILKQPEERIWCNVLVDRNSYIERLF